MRPAFNVVPKSAPPTASGSTRRIRRGVGLLVLYGTAVAVRLAVVLTARTYLLDHTAYEYGQIAAHLVNGQGFSIEFLGRFGPTASQAPVYPALVAAAYYLFGIDSAAALLWIQVAQAFLGGLIPVLVLSLGQRLMPEAPAALGTAAVILVFHPTTTYAVTHIQPITLLSVLTLSMLITAAELAGRLAADDGPPLPAGRVALRLGFLGGLTVLTDPILALVYGVSLAIVLWWIPPLGVRSKSRTTAVRAAHALLAVGVSLLVVGPWLVRNYRVFGEFVPVKSTFGYAFWQGNHPRSFGTDKIPRALADDMVAAFRGGLRELAATIWQARHETRYIDDMVLSPQQRAALGRLPEPQRCRVLLEEAIGYVIADPGRYAKLCLQRLRFFLLFDDTNPRTRYLPYRVYHSLFVTLSLLGLWTLRHRLRTQWPLLVAYGLVCLFHSMTIVSIRFRIPIEPLQVLYAAAGLVAAARFGAPYWQRHNAEQRRHGSHEHPSGTHTRSAA